jgi:hypothetical protein
MHLFGLGDPVDVFVSFAKDGTINGVFSTGHEERARSTTELPHYDRWEIDAPELGPTRIFIKPPDSA